MKTIFSCSSRRGMVLLEVLAALTLFAVVSLSLVAALNHAMETANDRNRADAAARALANQLALLRGASLVPGDRDLPDDGSGLSYHLKIAPEPMEDQGKHTLLGLYRATVTVQWKNGKQVESRDISELIYQP